MPDVNVAPRAARSKVGHFVGDVAYDGFAHYLEVYRAGVEELPAFDEINDIATAFGSVRVYRFDGPSYRTPVVLLPGRNAATPMWRANLAALSLQRTVYAVDLLGEAGLSVQTQPIADADEQAQWLDETLSGLELTRAHLLGASIGGWAAVNYGVRRPGRVASLTLLDAVQTFGRIPLKTALATGALMSPGVPEVLRQRVLRWIGGGAVVDEAEPEVRLISAAMVDFVLRLPAPKLITDEQLGALDIPVLAFIAGRSVMLHAARAAKQATLVPNAQVELWEQASHAINAEHPRRVAERAERFWAEIDA